jgi:hypothetical protein
MAMASISMRAPWGLALGVTFWLLVIGCGGGAARSPDGGPPVGEAGSDVDLGGPQACTSSSTCGSARWCNPASNLCEARSLPPARTFVADVEPMMEREVCSSCHSPGGAALQNAAFPLLFNGSTFQTWSALVGPGTDCSDGTLRPICTNEPSTSLLVKRVLRLPGAPPAHQDPNFVAVYDSWAAPDLQGILEWIAQGAPFGEAPDAAADGAAGDSSADGSPGAGRDGSGPPACDRTTDPAASPCMAVDGTAIFVAPTGNDGAATGTRAAPFGSVTRALAAALLAQKPVFACAGDYAEQLEVGGPQDGATIFGGFDCATWLYTGTRARLVPTAQGPALHVHDLALGFELRDFEVVAPDASAPGGTSNAALVSSSQKVRFVRVALRAGKGAAGAAGMTGADGSSQEIGTLQAPGFADSANFPNCQDSSGGDYTCSYGGNGGVRQCVGGVSTFGGNGGGALDLDYGWVQGEGSAGILFGTQQQQGTDGPGGTSNDRCPQQAAVACTAGGPGGPGSVGAAALGALGTGMLDSTGWSGLTGATGGAGTPGHGGGGGGAASEASCFRYSSGYCDCSNVDGGGGGTAGGCGGGGGIGGGPGGSSIALISSASMITLVDCTLTASDAGAGGTGGPGGTGQKGAASPGSGYVGYANMGCSGGLGGDGGVGGPGGGGQGGHSLGVAFIGSAPVLMGTTVTFGAAGKGGQAGLGNPTPAQAPFAGVGGIAAVSISAWSDQTVDVVPPSSVSVTATWASCHALAFSWTAATDDRPGVLSYSLCISTVAGACAAGTNTATTIIVNDSTQTTVSNLVPGQYFFSVVVTDGSGNVGPRSSEGMIPAYADVTPPAPPFNVSLYASSSSTVDVSWQLGADDCSTAIVLQYCISTDPAACAGPSAVWGPLNPSHIDGLQPSTTYYVSLREVDQAGNHSTAVTQSVTTTAVALAVSFSDIQSFITNSCTKNCHCPQDDQVIPLSYASLTTTNVPTETSCPPAHTPVPRLSNCPWISTSDPVGSSFIYQITQGSFCGHPQMRVADTSALKTWLAAGAPAPNN